MEKYIVDASVGIKWFFEEELAEQAKHFLRSREQSKAAIIVPEFFYFEFASACFKKVRRGIIKSKHALDVLDAVTNLSLKRYPDHELADIALENALQYDISVYDGIYLSLAEIYVAPLVTADEVFFNRVKDRFEFIEFLGDCRS